MENNLIIRFFKGNGKNVERDCFIWNTAAGLVNAAEAIVFMMVVTRTNGVEAAGILSIAFAVGNLMMTLGKFGVRNYQATDVKKEFAFHTYFTLRIITVMFMAVGSIGYIAFNGSRMGYTAEKAAAIAGICFIYLVESFEDVFLGYHQVEGRLDAASKIFVCRWLVIMAVFSVSVFIRHNLVFAVWLAAGCSVIVEILLLFITGKIFRIPSLRFRTEGIQKMARQCLPLFVVAFLTYYVTNAPKYAIDGFLSEDMQAYYGYISMPVFVVELLNCFLYQPQIVKLAQAWNEKNMKLLKQKEIRQFLIILLLTVFCVVGAYLAGIPVLSILYGVDLSKFRPELLVLMTSGGALAFVGYTSVLLTVMRKQNLLLCNMLVITVFAVAGFSRIVRRGGIMGVSLYYLVLMCLLAILNYCCIVFAEHRMKTINKIYG